MNIHLDTTILVLHQNTIHATILEEMTSLHVFCI